MANKQKKWKGTGPRIKDKARKTVEIDGGPGGGFGSSGTATGFNVPYVEYKPPGKRVKDKPRRRRRKSK